MKIQDALDKEFLRLNDDSKGVKSREFIAARLIVMQSILRIKNDLNDETLGDKS